MTLNDNHFGTFEVPDEIEEKIYEFVEKMKQDCVKAGYKEEDVRYEGMYWKLLGIYCFDGEAALNDYMKEWKVPAYKPVSRGYGGLEQG